MDPLNPPMLFDDIDDSALVLSHQELLARKRYTAGQLQRLDQLRTAVIMLLPAWPTDVIAKQLQLNHRTVSALAAREMEKVAHSKKDFVANLRSAAARAVALMRTKEADASYAQLGVGLGIMLDKARDLEMSLEMGQNGENNDVTEQPDRRKVLEDLRAWFDAAVDQRQRQLTNGQPVDLQSIPNTLKSSDIRLEPPESDGFGASGDGTPSQSSPACAQDDAPAAGTGGGGCERPQASNSDMGALSGDYAAKEPPDSPAAVPQKKGAQKRRPA